MTKEEFDSYPKRICILCSTTIIDVSDWPLRHLLDAHNKSLSNAVRFENWPSGEIKKIYLSRYFTEPFGASVAT